MSTQPRFSSQERDRDVREALDTRVEERVVEVERYVAQGLATARISLSTGTRARPKGVVLIDARPYFDQGGPLVLTPSFSFVWDSASKTAQVYEPGGLASNTAYRLTFKVIGG